MEPLYFALFLSLFLAISFMKVYPVQSLQKSPKLYFEVYLECTTLQKIPEIYQQDVWYASTADNFRNISINSQSLAEDFPYLGLSSLKSCSFFFWLSSSFFVDHGIEPKIDAALRFWMAMLSRSLRNFVDIFSPVAFSINSPIFR